MRGIKSFNFPAFDAAEDHIRNLGHEPVSPAALDRQIGFDPDRDEATPEFIRKALSRDMAAVCECDAVAVLPGWQASKGANIEVALARLLGLPILDQQTLNPFHETVLDEAKRLVYGDRGLDYGHPLDECTRIAAFWSIVLKHRVRPEQVPLCMIGMKVSREMNRRKRDNCVDIAGYAECLDRIHNEKDRLEREVDDVA